jgi:hypothetical protein
VKGVEAIRQFASVPWLEKLEAVFVECQMYDQDIEFYNEEINPGFKRLYMFMIERISIENGKALASSLRTSSSGAAGSACPA